MVKITLQILNCKFDLVETTLTDFIQLLYKMTPMFKFKSKFQIQFLKKFSELLKSNPLKNPTVGISFVFLLVLLSGSFNGTARAEFTMQDQKAQESRKILRESVAPSIESLFPGQTERWRRVFDAAEETAVWMQEHGLPLGGVALTVGTDASFFIGGNGGYDLLILPGPGNKLIVSKFHFIGPQVGAGGSIATGLTLNYVANINSVYEYAGWFLGISGRLTPSIGVNGSLQFGVTPADARKLLSLAYSWISGGVTDFLTTALTQMREARVSNIGFGGGVGLSAKVSATLTYYTLDRTQVIPQSDLPQVIANYFYEIGFGG